MYSVGEELSKAHTAELFASIAHDDRITRASYLEVREKVFCVFCADVGLLSVHGEARRRLRHPR